MRADAEAVKLAGMLSALAGRIAILESADQPSPLPVDPNMPSQAERDAMRERLQAQTLEGIAANRKDRNRAARTYRRESSG